VLSLEKIIGSNNPFKNLENILAMLPNVATHLFFLPNGMVPRRG
jgi:hypothetical protein